MISGEYPCCKGALFISLPENTPQFYKEICPHCGKIIWHYLSRLDPHSYTEEEFLEEYEINEENKSIKKINDENHGAKK